MLEFYNEFKKHLGMFDASIEYLEFCSRYISKNNDDLENKIQSTGINLNQEEINNIKKMPYQMYILGTYGIFEEFLTDYRDCIVENLDIEVKDYNNMPKLDILIKALEKIDDFKNDINSLSDSIEYQCLVYYRYCRNRSAHQGTDFEKKLKQSFEKIQKHSDWNELYLKYPISYSDLSFNDFTLMSKCILDLVERLMVIIQKKNLDLLKKLDTRKLNRFFNNPNRYEQAIIQMIITELNLNKNDACNLYKLYKGQK